MRLGAGLVTRFRLFCVVRGYWVTQGWARGPGRDDLSLQVPKVEGSASVICNFSERSFRDGGM